MKILHVVGWLAPRYGGTVAVVSKLVPRLTERGHAVEVWTTNADGAGVLPVETNRLIEWNGMSVLFHPLHHPKRYLVSWDLLRHLRQRVMDFDVVHIHSLYRFPGVAAARVARAHGVPYFVQAHGALDPWNRARRRLAKSVYHSVIEDRTLRRSAAVICTSPQEADAIRKLGLGVSTPVIPLGVDPWTYASAEASLVPALPPYAQRVTFLGRISLVKGLDLLVEAFRITAAANPSAHLVIAGPDDEGIFRRLTPRIAAMGLSDRVTYVGSLDENAKHALLSQSSVFVLPSAGESFGISVAEAMEAGCPVVVSTRVAIGDAVTNAGAGLVTERTPRALADAMSHILSHPEEAAAMGRAGKRVVRERFRWPTVAERLELVYAAALAPSADGTGPSDLEA